jgi:hypothetical protein
VGAPLAASTVGMDVIGLALLWCVLSRGVRLVQ